MFESLARAAGGVAALSASVFCALLGALYHWQRAILFPRPDNDHPAPIRKGTHVRVDVAHEARPRGVPNELCAVYFAPTTSRHVLAFWHGNADQIGAVGDQLGAILQRNRGWGFFGVEYPGYGLCRGGEPTEASIQWAADRMMRHLRDELGIPVADTCAFGQSVGGAVALEMAHRGHAAKVVLLSSFASIPKMCSALFPFVPAADRLVKDPFDNAAIAPAVTAPALCAASPRPSIFPFSFTRDGAHLNYPSPPRHPRHARRDRPVLPGRGGRAAPAQRDLRAPPGRGPQRHLQRRALLPRPRQDRRLPRRVGSRRG